MKELKELFDNISAILIGCKFEKKGENYIRKLDWCIQIIEVQKYSYKVDGKVSITLNIGIIIPEIFKTVFNKNTSFKYYEGIIKPNIGEIYYDFKGRIINKSWEIDDVKLIIPEIETIFVNVILPFFDSIKIKQDIISFYNQNPSYYKKQPYSVKAQFEILLNEFSKQ